MARRRSKVTRKTVAKKRRLVLAVKHRRKTVSKRRSARAANGSWYPAAGGTEKPFTKKGYRLLYVFQPSTKRHGYLDLDNDIVLSDEQALKIML